MLVDSLKQEIERLKGIIAQKDSQISQIQIALQNSQEELNVTQQANEQYNIERNNLSNGINKLRHALKMTQDSLKQSEEEKKQAKDKIIQFKIILDKLKADKGIDIKIPE